MLWGLLERHGVLWGCCWDGVGLLLGSCWHFLGCSGVLWGCSWNLLGCCLDLLGCSWGTLGVSWGCLGTSWVLLGTLGVLLGRLLKTYMGKRVPLGALGVLLEYPGDVLRLLGVLLRALIENLYGEESAFG